MTKRLCDYCKFEIPSDAITCGHCGKDIPYITEARFCKIHKANYNVRIEVRTGNEIDRCKHCIMDDNEKLIAERKTEDDARIKLQKELEPLRGHLSILEENYSAIQSRKIAEKNTVDFGLVIVKMTLLFIPGSLIIGGLLCAILNLGFLFSFGISYFCFCFLFIILPYIKYNTLTKELESNGKAQDKIRQEIESKGGNPSWRKSKQLSLEDIMKLSSR
ncbi:MAG: hypothetical protein CVU51_06480 [Deltaproteobacteria bacterium HGW-Deltaproteobacteria-1]|nr:MAG: hypothetical protein CVU51_06480 [Deltaproteobacteria bacterium HGW-Deltaproteobacteria-1]